MPRLKFLRRNWSKASRLGKGRKKKQIWRSAKGRHSKTRNKRKGYPAIVEVGFGQDNKTKGLIDDKKPILVYNVKELGNVKKGEIAIIGKVGKKKKIEIAKVAKEKGISLFNLNAGKLLKKAEKKQKMKEETKTKKETKEEKTEEKKSEEKK
ncbi:MAG: eL32 family ribosomal protein [Nanoarchaeota archaeon]